MALGGPPKKMKVAGRARPKVEGLSRKINDLDATLEAKLIPQKSPAFLMWGKL
jgi:hypothetical protein